MKWARGPIIPAWFCAAILLLTGSAAHPEDRVFSPENRACLECHGKKGITKTFQSGEKISAHIDAAAFDNSVHRSMSCSDCHDEFSQGKHPDRRFRDKDQYRTKAARLCLRCHKEKEISTRPAHAGLGAGDGKVHVCTNCHSPHSIARVAGTKRFTNEEHYCMGCHGHDAKIIFKDGGELSVKTDAEDLRRSVHGKLSCSDCHFGFSHEEHPIRNFRSRREYSLALSENCRRCHYDKYTKTLESAHYTILSQGNLNAPSCTDCHGSHSISGFEKERPSIAQRCRKCHAGIYDIYAKSVHGRALSTGQNSDVPVCTDCHRAHDIGDPLTAAYHQRIPEMCGNCHANKTIAERYGLSTNVVKSYLSDFHGITLRFYQKQRETLTMQARPIAVCTDCHGTHNIISTRNTDSAVVKANLRKRCQECHKEASKNFPDAWLSHYEPSMKKAPLVFFVNLVYEIFMPFMITGLFLQIALHVWRYARNR